MSVGTAVLPDPDYLSAVASCVESIGSRWYIEHLAFTKVPDLPRRQLPDHRGLASSSRQLCSTRT